MGKQECGSDRANIHAGWDQSEKQNRPTLVLAAAVEPSMTLGADRRYDVGKT